MPMKTTISCIDDHGTPISVPVNKLTFRPAVYGICLIGAEILLLRDEESAFLRPPGKILDHGEAPVPSIIREFRRLTGVTPTLGPMLLVQDLYRIDGNGRPWHLLAMYYELDRPSTFTFKFNYGKGCPQPELYLVSELQRQQIQFGYEAIQAAWQRQNIS